MQGKQPAARKENSSKPSKVWEILAWLCVAGLLAYLALSIPQTKDWKLIHDAPLMHYIAWLMSEGMVPYRDIFDMNMPGTYLIHFAVLKTLGEGDQAWRLFDLGWLALTFALIIFYCKRQGYLAGITAATIFACFHIAGGDMMAGQRDFLMLPFLVLGGHFVAYVTENRQRMISAFFAGVLFGCAFWIKPHVVVLFIMLFLYAKIVSHSIFVSLLMGLGFLLPGAGVIGYLYLNQALLPWWEIVSQYLIPIYSTIGPDLTAQELIFTIVSSLAILLPFLALSTPLTGRFFVSLMGVIYGIFHFIIQKKGLEYHLSPLFLWASIFAAYRIGSNLKAPRTAPRLTGLIGIATACLLASPLYLMNPDKLMPSEEAHNDMSAVVTDDLRAILKPGDDVQIMDHTSGAIHAALNLKLKPATRFLRDFHFFTATDKYYVQQLEDEFIRTLNQKMPKAVIVTDQSWPDETRGFTRLNDSPNLLNLLIEKYYLQIDNPQYRIYIRR